MGNDAGVNVGDYVWRQYLSAKVVDDGKPFVWVARECAGVLRNRLMAYGYTSDVFTRNVVMAMETYMKKVNAPDCQLRGINKRI